MTEPALRRATVLDVERARLIVKLSARLGRPVSESVRQVAQIPLPDEVRNLSGS